MIRNHLLTVPIVVLSAFLFSAAAAEGAEWRFCTENPFLKLYYDEESLSRPTPDLMRVWVKYRSRGKKGNEFWIHIRKLDKISTKEYKHFSHHIALYEINCSERTYQRISGIDYDQDKRMLHNFSSSPWEPIYPESMVESLFKKVCPKGSSS